MGRFKQALLDGWESLAQASLGQSANAHPRKWVYNAPPNLAPPALGRLYDGSWAARRVVSLKVETALKEGLLGHEPSIKRLAELNPQHAPEGLLYRALVWCRLYGGCHVIAGHARGQGNMRAPLDEADPGEVVWLDVVARHNIKILNRKGRPSDPDPNAPVLFEVTGGPRQGLVYHASRCLQFSGDTPSQEAWASRHDSYWGQSVLQSVYEELLRLGQRNASVDRIMTRASTQALEMSGILQAIAQEEAGALTDRLQVLAEGIERTDLVLLEANAGEKYHTHSATLSGIDQPAMQALQQLSGAAGYPLTLFLGTSPGGLNATGASDITLYYDAVRSYQSTYIQPNASRLLRWLGAPEGFEVSFPPLETLTPKERRDGQKLTIDEYNVIEQWGAVDASELVKSLQRAELLDDKIVVNEDTDDGQETDAEDQQGGAAEARASLQEILAGGEDSGGGGQEAAEAQQGDSGADS